MMRTYKILLFYFFLCLSLSCSQQTNNCVENYNSATKHIESENYESAISVLKNLPNTCYSDSTYFLISFCYQRKLEWDSAILYSEKALAVNPNFTKALSNLASLYSINDSTCKKALVLMLKLDSIKPDFEYQITLAKIYNCLKKYSKEIECLDIVINKNPDDFNNYETRAMAYWNNNQQEKAIEDFTTVLTVDPNNVDILHKRAMTMIDIGNVEGACIDLKKAKSLNHIASKDAYKRNCPCSTTKNNNKNTIRKIRIS